MKESHPGNIKEILEGLKCDLKETHSIYSILEKQKWNIFILF